MVLPLPYPCSSQPLEDPFRGMVLFSRLTLILLQDLVDDLNRPNQPGQRRRPAPPIPRRHRKMLCHRPPGRS
jgi:hypothetical protein